MSHPMNQSVNDDRSVNSEDDTKDKLQTYWNEKFNFYKFELNKVKPEEKNIIKLNHRILFLDTYFV